MKLVDILARDLKEWPEEFKVLFVTQDQDGRLYGWQDSHPECLSGEWVWRKERPARDLASWRPGKFDGAEDRSTSIVTRSQWQAAVDALKAGEQASPEDKVHVSHGAILRDEALRSLQYKPATGQLVWKENKQRRFIGCEAGSVNHHGYRRMHVLNTRIDAHRLVWLMHYGVLPDGEIDHINGNKLDNRLENLRLADQQRNQQNVGVRVDSRLGVKGVRLRPSGKYQARVKLTDGSRLVKSFESLESAVAWLSTARKESHGEFARDSAEQIAANARESSAYAMCAIAKSLTNTDAFLLHDAGFQKQPIQPARKGGSNERPAD